MNPVVDYSKVLQRLLANGRTLDEAMTELRRVGASIIDCIVSLKTFRHCEIGEAKQIVEASPVWADHRNITEKVLRVWSDTNDQTEA